MKIAINLILAIALMLPWQCGASDKRPIDGNSVRAVMQHYFSADVKLGVDRPPFYVSGDFNDDGLQDIAVLFYPKADQMRSSQLHPSGPWSPNGKKQSDEFHKSLAIINGPRDGWQSPEAKVFILLDTSGVLETPSFQLILKKKSEDDHGRYLKKISVRKAGDLIILPTEAGIDTYLYWDDSLYRLHQPEEEP